MTIIQSYCYCFSLRRGCFFIGIFTLIFYTGVVAGGSFYVHDSLSVALLVLSSLMVILSIFCVIASVFLIVGLCVESKKLLIPWIVVVSVTTCMDIVFANIVFFFKRELSNADEVYREDEEETPTIYAIDIIIVLFNIYSVLCVLSQYHDYCEGRGTAEYNFKNPRRNRLKVTYSSQIKLDQSCKWATMESSESKCHLMIPRNSLNTENSCVTTFDDMSNTSARSSITTALPTVDRFYENNISEIRSKEPNDKYSKCDQTVVQLEPVLCKDQDSTETNVNFNNDFVCKANAFQECAQHISPICAHDLDNIHNQ